MKRNQKLVLLAGLIAMAGCHTDMWAQPQTRPLEPSTVFPDGGSARTQVPDTIAFTSDPRSATFTTGMKDGHPVQKVPVDEELLALHLPNLKGILERGRTRFDIFCSPCHGRLGDGHGMITQRGLKLVRQPRNFHDPRIVDAPDGYLFEVITHGTGAMMSYDDRIPPADRWAIVAYVRALELSQGASFKGGGR